MKTSLTRLLTLAGVTAAIGATALVVTASSASAANSDIPGGGYAHLPSSLGTTAPTAAVPATPSGYSVSGIDVSAYQTGVNWSTVAGAGASFAYAKATEGNGYTSQEFNSQYDGAKNAGLYRGAYDFGRPDQRSGASEADFFLDHARYVNDGQTLPPMLDIEWPWSGSGVRDTCYNLSTSQMVTWIRDFVTEVRARTGQPTMLYTATSWWNQCTGSNGSFGDNYLFIAHYDGSPGTLPPGWSKWTLWQYSSSGSLPGDQDVLNGTRSDLAALTAGPAGQGYSRPSMALTSGGWLQATARGTSGELRNISMNPSTGKWTDWGSITTNGVVGDPAVTVGSDGNTVVVYRGADGSLHEWWMDKSTGQWGTTGAIAGNLASDPSITTTSSGALQVIARGTSGELRNISMNPSTGKWTDWGSITTNGVVGDPAVTVGSDGNTVVIYQGSDAKLHQWWMDRNTGNWATPGAIGGTATITGDPAAAVDSGGNVNVVAPGGNYTLQQAWMNKTTGVWAGTQTVATNIA